MIKLIKYSVCFLITLFLLSCSNEEAVGKQENVNNVKKDLKLNKFSNQNIAENVEVDFESVKEIEKDNFKISEIPAKEKNASFLKSNFLQSQLKYQAITIDYENKSYSYLLEIYAHKSSAVYLGTITKLKDFSGTFNVYSFEGENLGSIGVSKGIAKNISEKEDLNILTKAINLFSDKSNLTNRIPPCDRPAYVPMQYVTDYYQEVLFDGKPLSYIWVRQEVKTIQVLVTYPCDSPADVVARNYVAAILNDHGTSGGGTSSITSKSQYDNLVNSTYADGTDFGVEQQNQDNFIARVRFAIVPWAGVQFYINEQKVGGKFEVQDVTSLTFGLNSGFGWEQAAFSKNTNGTTTTLIVYGAWSYSLFIEGVGNLYSQPYTYEIKMNNTNGEIISGRRL